MSDAGVSGDIKESFVEDANKIDIKPTQVNLGCMKNEPNEEALDFEEDSQARQYRITLKYENIFGEPSHQLKIEEDYDNLIGFSDNDVIMENAMVKLEIVKEEEDGSSNNFHCRKCKGIYKGFCLNCSTLLHILNNNLPFVKSESQSNTVPTDILEIRGRGENGVYLLRTLPINVIFGPFEGILGIESTLGYSWKVIDKKLKYIKFGNWMKNIACATSDSLKNLDSFQIDGNLYFQTNRVITEGEELLFYYDDEELQELDNSEECLYTPRKQEKLPKIFACTMCCLGFGSNKCLMEHKRKCFRMEDSRSMKDFVLIECHYCKMWMEKWEHEEHHVAYCLEKCHRLSCSRSQPVDRNQVKVEEVEDGLDNKALHGEFKCSQCSYETNDEKNLQTHLNTHKKPFQCGICMMYFTLKDNLKRHIKNKHSENGCSKAYHCSECIFQTNEKIAYQNHINRHRGIKPFECGICKMTFTQKQSLKAHIKNKHTKNGGVKDYQCSECTYQTSVKHHYQTHLDWHRGIKPFECGTCKMKFTQKINLRTHIKNKHSENGCAKDYHCSECSYQTNYKQHYQDHLNRHRGIKPLECGICKTKFIQTSNLRTHIKNKHSEDGCAKDYQCGICKKTFAQKSNLRTHIKNKHSENGRAKDYQTNDKTNYRKHQNVHSGIKPFECGICKTKFTTKGNLKTHIKNKHTENGCAKDYQCSECTFQTNNKTNFHVHLNVHRGIKPFECGICKIKFTQKHTLKTHITKKH